MDAGRGGDAKARAVGPAIYTFAAFIETGTVGLCCALEVELRL